MPLIFFFTYRIFLNMKDKRFKLIQANMQKIKKIHRPEAVKLIRKNEGVTRSAFTHASPAHSSARASWAEGQHKRI